MPSIASTVYSLNHLLNDVMRKLCHVMLCKVIVIVEKRSFFTTEFETGTNFILFLVMIFIRMYSPISMQVDVSH